jgi:hypothetical protein
MIVVGISMKEGEWYKKYIPIFIMKYNYFLINNIFLPKEMALNVATYYDFIAILLVMLWIKPVHKILASVLKTSTRSTLLFRAGFYTLFAMCRFQSINSALERYTGEPFNQVISCLVILEFNSIFFSVISYKQKIFKLLTSSTVAIIASLYPEARIVVLLYLLWR